MTKVSIIIPVKPGGSVRALDGLERVDYPTDLYEVLVAEGKQPSCQRNRAAAAAQGDILYFLDDDSLVDPLFLQRMVGHFAHDSVAAVGGPSLTPLSDTFRQRAFGLVLTSLLGGGGVRNRYRQWGAVRDTDDSELILCNLGFRRDLFIRSGGLDERLYPNEENELLVRLVREGWRLVHDPALAVERSQRKTFGAFVRQFLSYGRGRAEQMLIGGGGGVLHLLPPLLVIYLCLFPFFASTRFALPLAGYLAAVIIYSLVGVFSARQFALFPLLLLAFPLLHLSYGIGEIRGLLRPRFRGKACEAAEVTITKVKTFEGSWAGDLRRTDSPDHPLAGTAQ